MAKRGVVACMLALLLMCILPNVAPENAVKILFAGATCLAFTSATVVNALTSYASLQCDEPVDIKDPITGKPLPVVGGEPSLAKGRALGEFRSSGQLGRAIGPLLGTLEAGFLHRNMQ